MLEPYNVRFIWDGKQIAVHFRISLMKGVTDVQVFAGEASESILGRIDAKILSTTPNVAERMYWATVRLYMKLFNQIEGKFQKKC